MIAVYLAAMVVTAGIALALLVLGLLWFGALLNWLAPLEGGSPLAPAGRACGRVLGLLLPRGLR